MNTSKVKSPCLFWHVQDRPRDSLCIGQWDTVSKKKRLRFGFLLCSQCVFSLHHPKYKLILTSQRVRSQITSENNPWIEEDLLWRHFFKIPPQSAFVHSFFFFFPSSLLFPINYLTFFLLNKFEFPPHAHNLTDSPI